MHLSDLSAADQAALRSHGLTWNIVGPSVRVGASIDRILECADAAQRAALRSNGAPATPAALRWLLGVNLPEAIKSGVPQQAVLVAIDAHLPWTDVNNWFRMGLPLDVFLDAAATHGDLSLPALLLKHGVPPRQVLGLTQGLRYNPIGLDILTRFLRDGWLTPEDALEVARRANLSTLHDVTSVLRRKDPSGTAALTVIFASLGYSSGRARIAAMQAAGTSWAPTLLQLVADGMPLDAAVTAARLLEQPHSPSMPSSREASTEVHVRRTGIGPGPGSPSR